MTHPDLPNEPTTPEGVRPDVVRVDTVPIRPDRSVPARPAPRPRGGGILALALLLALAAAGGAGYVGWQQWQHAQSSATQMTDLGQLQQRVAKLESTVSGVSGERQSLSQRLDDAAAVNRSLREELLSESARTRNLEDAVAKLAEKSLSGHDATLLDETESLLRMADERYTLFHDAQGAAAAYSLADQTLAAVNDSAFAGLRQSIAAERDALAKSQPASQAAALQELTGLRASLATLPLKPLNGPDDAHATDAWSRIRRALGSVISVQRTDGAPLAVADARFARELAALDLAQAQTALLAYDSKNYAAALQRVDAALASQFDDTDAAVKQMRTTIKHLASALPDSGLVPLGAALNELRNLRTVHALAPAADATPATASSAAAHGEATP